VEFLFKVLEFCLAEGTGAGALPLEGAFALLQQNLVLCGDPPPHLFQILASVFAGIHIRVFLIRQRYDFN
jgi:hypothetical protein